MFRSTRPGSVQTETAPDRDPDLGPALSDYDSVAVHSIEYANVTAAELTGIASSVQLVEVTDDNPAMAAALALAFNHAGCRACVVSEPSLSTDALVVTSGVSGEQAVTTDFTGEQIPTIGLAGEQNLHRKQVSIAHKQAGLSVDTHWQSLMHARAAHQAGTRLLVLLQDTAGCFHGGPSRGWNGGHSALARTAAREWPQMQVRCIDVDMSTDTLDACACHVVSALRTNLPVLGVDRAGRLSSPRTGPRLRMPLMPLQISGGVWLVTGGARGVTAACTQQLAARTQGRFALLGRAQPETWPSGIEHTDDLALLRSRLAVQAREQGTHVRPADINQQMHRSLASQEIQQSLIAMQATGSQVQYYTCDVTRPDQVRDTIERVQEELGTITGLVHGAGVLADRLIVDKTRTDVERVFNTKVSGLAALLDTLALDALTHIALFSSAAAFFGNPGQADYAMANEVMNRVASTLNTTLPAARIKSFNWGPWDGGMVGPELARHFATQGIGLIGRDVGARIFVSELLDGSKDDVEVLVGDPWPAQ